MNYDKDWYNSLIKPHFQPPEWVFAPVWTVIYILMIVAFIIVLKTHLSFQTFLAIVFFSLQLWVNLSWSPAFFEEHNLRKAFLLSTLLTLLVLATMLTFFHISKLAGFLFLPYFLWCCFATVLSFEILELNEW